MSLRKSSSVIFDDAIFHSYESSHVSSFNTRVKAQTLLAKLNCISFRLSLEVGHSDIFHFFIIMKVNPKHNMMEHGALNTDEHL